MSKNVYCGSASNPPKGSRFGSMQECIERNQIRRYGVKQIDSRLMASSGKIKGDPTATDKIKVKIVGLRGRESRIEKEMNSKAAKNDKSKMDELKKQLKETKKQIDNLRAKII